MPLAKLQRFGEGRHTTEDRFIYDFSWREEIRTATPWPGPISTTACGFQAQRRRLAGPPRPAHPPAGPGQMGSPRCRFRPQPPT